MGRTIPEFRIASAMEQNEWKESVLTSQIRKVFDRMFSIAHLYNSAYFQQILIQNFKLCGNRLYVSSLLVLVPSCYFHCGMLQHCEEGNNYVSNILQTGRDIYCWQAHYLHCPNKIPQSGSDSVLDMCYAVCLLLVIHSDQLIIPRSGLHSLSLAL